jgi:hypothetical protein
MPLRLEDMKIKSLSWTRKATIVMSIWFAFRSFLGRDQFATAFACLCMFLVSEKTSLLSNLFRDMIRRIDIEERYQFKLLPELLRFMNFFFISCCLIISFRFILKMRLFSNFSFLFCRTREWLALHSNSGFCPLFLTLSCFICFLISDTFAFFGRCKLLHH